MDHETTGRDFSDLALALVVALERAAMGDPDLQERIRHLRTEVPRDLDALSARRLAALARNVGEAALHLRCNRMEHEQRLAQRVVEAVGRLDEVLVAPELELDESQAEFLRVALSGVRRDLHEIDRGLLGTADVSGRTGPPDPLDEITTRQPLKELLRVSLRVARNTRVPLCVLRIYVNDLSKISETLGPALADEILRSVAQRAAAILREKDVVARTGMRDFGVMLPGTTLGGALRVADRILSGVGQLSFTHDGRLFRVTSSIGVVQTETKDTVESISLRLDAALGRARHGGCNQVEAA